ncbi:MAG: hypothetical protein EOO47_11535 [Flavobacterium sp.]|nr:MAG: hypothetical protein EOO47_11535 [Flavobacterium sp.]
MLSDIPKPAIYAIVVSVVVFTIFVSLGVYFFSNFKEFKKAVIVKQLSAKRKTFDFEKESDSKFYESSMVEFMAMEDMAKNIFPIDTTLSGREKSLSDINDIGIYYWTRNLEVLESLGELNMPKELVKKTELLKAYCSTSRGCYELMYKAIDKHTKKYDEEINGCIIKVKEQKDFIIANY